MQGHSDPNRELLDAAALCRKLVPEGSVEGFLADHRQELFSDEMFADLFPSTREWVREFTARFQREPHYYAVMSYVALVAAAKAIEAAGSLDRDKIVAALEKVDTMTPMGPLKFSPSKFAVNHAFKQMMMFEWQKGTKVLIFPKDIATGSLIYPFPAWNQR